MKISWQTIRTQAQKWGISPDFNPPHSTSKFVKLLSTILRILTFLRNWGYDKKVFSIYKAKVPVISIGNLTMGGTGKTPITNLVLQFLVGRNKRVVLISRAYKAKAQSPMEVDLTFENPAEMFGDEAVMLAKSNPKVRVFVGRNKRNIAAFVSEQIDNFDVIVVDDGFQHRSLHRDLDIVLLDATESLNNYDFFPAGRAREGFSSLKRADLVIYTKFNLATEETLNRLSQFIPQNKPYCSIGFRTGVIHAGFNWKPMENVPGVFLPPNGEEIYLIAGIAKPSVFLQMFRHRFPLNQFHLIAFNDHHNYIDSDVRLILNRSRYSHWIVTTQKDWIKLEHVWPKDLPIWISDLDLNIEVGKDLLFQRLDHCIQK